MDESNAQKIIQLLANSSSSLYTPLNAVINYPHVILSGKLGYSDIHDEFLRQDLQHIIDSGKHLFKMITDLLRLTKLEAGTMQIDIEIFDLSELLEKISSKQEQRTVSVEPPEYPIEMISDSYLITEMIGHILEEDRFKNAVLRGYLINPESVCVEIRIADSRFYNDDLANLFNLDRATTVEDLKLPVADRLANLLGGTLYAQQQGTTSVFLSSPCRSNYLKINYPAS